MTGDWIALVFDEIDDIAVVERGVCTFTEKVGNVIAVGGYDAVLVFNRVGSDGADQPCPPALISP
jgi:ApbE superfamily uncharacterized protein (UPF0280 family)